MAELEDALTRRSSHPSAPQTSQHDTGDVDTDFIWDASITDLPDSARDVTVAETPYTVRLNLSCSLGGFPASSMAALTLNDRSIYAGSRPDLISCGTISKEVGEQLHTFYQLHLNPLLNHVLAENATLAEVRARSSLLTAAICTVAAFCTHSKHYQSCLQVFKDEVSSILFSSQYIFDDVRALCIGAFWLKDTSAAFNGLAVRIATELDLHRCIGKMPHNKRSCYDRTRLYFVVYLCDHHCSLIYGRPPMTREWWSLKRPGAFLRSDYSDRKDLKLISEVELWSITRQVFEQFGADIEDATASDRIVDLERLKNAYDTWRHNWLDASIPQEDTGSRNHFVFELYYNSARLYLFSHAFRGPPSQSSNMAPGLPAAVDLAQSAFESAHSIICCVVDASGAQTWLNQLPFYFTTMIAFACVCLLQIPRRAPIVQNTDDVKDLLQRLARVLRMSSMAMDLSCQLRSIANGIENALGAGYNFGSTPFTRTLDEDSMDTS